jgi:L-malate glycosyltransferase
VMRFPSKNFVAKRVLKYNFKKADYLCATSTTIKDYISLVIKKDVTVVPFGVDTNTFVPKKVSSLFQNGDFVLGSTKPLEPIYNIDILIKSFSNLASQYPKLKLLIIGEGSSEAELRALAKQTGYIERIVFTGRVPFNKMNDYYNMIDVLVNISQYESFGVSVIEAMSCGKPVIVSDTGGLGEIVSTPVLGIKVEAGNIEQTAEAIEKLMSDEILYKNFVVNGRKHVENNYSWQACLDKMISIYNVLANKRS